MTLVDFNLGDRNGVVAGSDATRILRLQSHEFRRAPTEEVGASKVY